MTPLGSFPCTRTSSDFGFACRSVCVARTCSTSLVPIPRQELPMHHELRCDYHHTQYVIPGCVMPNSGPMTCTMPWSASPRSKSRTPNSLQLLRKVSICCFEIGSAIGNRRSVVNVMVRCRESCFRPSDTTACQSQPFKCLWTCYFMNKVPIYIQQRILTIWSTDNVIVPNFVKECSRSWHASVTIEEGNETFNVAGSEGRRYQ